MKKIINSLFIVMLGAFVFSSCVDDKFDEPDFPFTDPDIAVNSNIRQIKDLLGGNTNYEITDDLVFSAVVIANDSLGNFYKKIVVQDSTSGIEILIDGRNLYGKFPVGRRVFVKAKGLVLGRNRGVVQLGWTLSEGDLISILSKDVDKFVIGGSLKNYVQPKEMNICDYGEYDISTLVKFNNVQFDKGDLTKTFADGSTKTDKSRTLVDCAKNQFVVRTSGYAEFASDTLPAGNGSLVCVLGIYKYDDQAFECKRFQGAIRSLNDIVFDKERCGGGPKGDETLITIKSVRDMFANGQTTMADKVKIKGVVISDKENGNLPPKNLVIQDETAGIAIRFDGNHDFFLNDEVEIVVSNLETSEYNNLLQFNNVSLEAAIVTGSGSVEPRIASVQEILDNGEAWESTLVSIKEATISGGAIYKDFDVVVGDATGSIDLHTNKFASFAESPLPSGTVKVTAVVGQFKDNYQLLLRNLDDVEGGTPPPGDETLITIKSVRDMFANGQTTMANKVKIKGIVISDKENGNLPQKNLVIQDETAGIAIRFDGNHDFSLNDEVEIVVSNLKTSEYNNLLQFNNVSLGAATVIGTGSVTPRIASVKEILDNAEVWESTLVRVKEATISGGSNYKDKNVVVGDATGTINLYTRANASFGESSLPSGTVKVTAIVNQYKNSYQLLLRNLNDVE